MISEDGTIMNYFPLLKSEKYKTQRISSIIWKQTNK